MDTNPKNSPKKRSAKRGQGQKFKRKRSEWQADWLQDSKLKDWLEKHPTEEQMVNCKICAKSIRFTRKSDLTTHANTALHKDNVTAAMRLRTFPPIPVEEPPPIREEVEATELIIVHDVVHVKQEFNNDLQVLKGIILIEDKCSNILTNVSYDEAFDKLVKILNTTLFSILIDESADISDKKVFCISVQYVNPTSGKVLQHLLQLFELDVKHGTASDLFGSFQEFFDENKIEMKHIIALGYDNDSVSVSLLNDFQLLLKKNVPYLITLNCVCHTSAIIGESSCLTIPKDVEELVRSAYNYFSSNPKCSQELEEFTMMFSNNAKKLLRLPGPRWLGAYRSYDRLVELWAALEHHFGLQLGETTTQDKASSSQSNNEERIYNLLKDPSVNACVYFLNFVLNYHDSFNALYQRKGLMIHALHRSIVKILKGFSINFIKDEALPYISDADFDVKKNLKPLSEMYLGPTMEIIKVLPFNACETFLKNCQNFYISSFEYMRKKLLENDNLLKKLVFIEPEIALSLGKRKDFPDLVDLCDYFPFIDEVLLAFEWRKLPFAFEDNKVKAYAKMDVEEFWKTVTELNNSTDTGLEFPTLKKLTEAVFSLPQSNLEPKRTFADVNEMKDEKGNCISMKLLSIRLFGRSYCNAYDLKNVNYKLTQEHHELLNFGDSYSE